jgi:hypothetical protein
LQACAYICGSVQKTAEIPQFSEEVRKLRGRFRASKGGPASEINIDFHPKLTPTRLWYCWCGARRDKEEGRASVEGLAQNFLPVADPPADNSLAVEDRMQGKKVPPQRRDLTPHPHGRHPGALTLAAGAFNRGKGP